MATAMVAMLEDGDSELVVAVVTQVVVEAYVVVDMATVAGMATTTMMTACSSMALASTPTSGPIRLTMVRAGTMNGDEVADTVAMGTAVGTADFGKVGITSVTCRSGFRGCRHKFYRNARHQHLHSRRTSQRASNSMLLNLRR